MSLTLQDDWLLALFGLCRLISLKIHKYLGEAWLCGTVMGRIICTRVIPRARTEPWWGS